MTREEADLKYDVGLSFADEDRNVVESVAIKCRDLGVSVFYDKFAEAELWGKDLYDYLSDLYAKRCRFCLIFVSEAYAKKDWTTLERRSAQDKALRSAFEYILPVRLDDASLPGLLSNVGYIDLRKTTPSALADLICQKLGRECARNSPDMIVIELRSEKEFASDADMEMHELHSKLLNALGLKEARIIGCEPSPHRLQLCANANAHSRLRELFLSGRLTEQTGVMWKGISSLEGKDTAPPPRQVPLARLGSGGSGRNVVCHAGSISGLESEAGRAWDHLGFHNVVSDWHELQAFVTEKDGLIYIHSNYKKARCEWTTKIATDSSIDLFELFINLVCVEWPSPSLLNEARRVHQRFAKYAVERERFGMRGDEFYAGAMNIDFI